MTESEQHGSPDVKQCCASLYGSDAARFLLGDSFHPGGIGLTLELSGMLSLTADSSVLDVASGRGASAFAVAERFGCRVTGIDFGAANVAGASAEAADRGLAERVTFVLADAEDLPFDSATFDAILCECAFCTFPDKATAASEFARVLRPQGRVGISDLTRVEGPLPELDGLLAWIACIGDAQPLDRYAAWLRGAGFSITAGVSRDECLRAMVAAVRGKLMVAEAMIGLEKLQLPGFDLDEAKRLANAADRAIKDDKLGYALLVGELLR
jgi:arsenite methyltransferase